MKSSLFLLLFTLTLAAPGCIRVKHEMTIQPMHITVEIRIKIDKELEDFFGDLDAAAPDTQSDSGGAS